MPPIVSAPPRLQRLDLLAILALAGLWGSAFIAIRAGLLAGASPFLFAALRFLLAAIAAAIVALATRTPLPSRRLLARAAVLGGLSLVGGYSVLVYWGETTTAGGLSAVLIATVPLWSGVLGHSVLPNERFGRGGWAGIVVGFLGVVVLLFPDLRGGDAASWAGPIALVAAAALFSVGSVTLRRLGGGPEGYWSLVAQFAASAAVLAPFAVLEGPLSFPVTSVTVGTLLYLAVGSSVVGFVLYFWLFHRVGPARAGFVTYVSPVMGLALGALLLGEVVSLLELAGFGLIVLGILLVRGERPVGERPRGAT